MQEMPPKRGYLAITALAIRTTVALVHILCMLLARLSSECWDTLEMLLTIALTSKNDTRIPKNTCAGISRTAKGKVSL